MILLIDKFLLLMHTSRQIKDAGEFVGKFGQKYTLQRFFYTFIMGLMLLIWTNLSYFSLTNQLAFIIFGIYLWIFIFYKFQKIKVYEKGMIFQGYYMSWSRIEALEIKGNDTLVIKDDKDIEEVRILNKVKDPNDLKALYEKYKDKKGQDEKYYDDNPLIDIFVTKVLKFRDRDKS
jgi:uncharacterized membrane protein YobD (UPF0266 family)